MMLAGRDGAFHTAVLFSFKESTMRSLEYANRHDLGIHGDDDYHFTTRKATRHYYYGRLLCIFGFLRDMRLRCLPAKNQLLNASSAD